MFKILEIGKQKVHTKKKSPIVEFDDGDLYLLLGNILNVNEKRYGQIELIIKKMILQMSMTELRGIFQLFTKAQVSTIPHPWHDI